MESLRRLRQHHLSPDSSDVLPPDQHQLLTQIFSLLVSALLGSGKKNKEIEKRDFFFSHPQNFSVTIKLKGELVLLNRDLAVSHSPTSGSFWCHSEHIEEIVDICLNYRLCGIKGP